MEDLGPNIPVGPIFHITSKESPALAARGSKPSVTKKKSVDEMYRTTKERKKGCEKTTAVTAKT